MYTLFPIWYKFIAILLSQLRKNSNNTRIFFWHRKVNLAAHKWSHRAKAKERSQLHLTLVTNSGRCSLLSHNTKSQKTKHVLKLLRAFGKYLSVQRITIWTLANNIFVMWFIFITIYPGFKCSPQTTITKETDRFFLKRIYQVLIYVKQSIRAADTKFECMCCECISRDN